MTCLYLPTDIQLENPWLNDMFVLPTDIQLENPWFCIINLPQNFEKHPYNVHLAR